MSAGAAHGRDRSAGTTHRGHGPLLQIACVLLAALLLYALAWQLTRQGIDRQAQAKAAIFATGHTPWDFAPHAAKDIVGGRTFGNAQLSQDSRGLIAHASSARPYELGVPLSYPLDLQHFPVARLTLQVQVPTRLQWLLRRSLDTPLLRSSAINLPPGEHVIRQDLRRLKWTQRPGGEAAQLPRTAAMLRLRLQHPPGTSVQLHALDWMSAAQMPGSQTSSAGTQKLDLLQLPIGRPEDMLRLRDAIRHEAPSTIVVASSGVLQSATRHRASPVPGLAALLAYGLILLLTWKRTRRTQETASMRRVLPILQIAVCAGPLLVFAIGMYGNPGPSLIWLSVMSAGMAFALWLAWRSYGQHWRWLHWRGHMAWRDWAMPALTTVAAAGLLLAFAAEPHLPSPRRLIGYGLWAGLQQLLILAALAPRLRTYQWPRWLCALGLAVIFALAHAPNAMLMQLTLLAELLWAWQFLRRPVLLPIILAHATAGLLLAMGIGELPLRSLEVGARFLQ